METPYYLSKLREQFSRRQRGSHTYSLRAFARDLKIHPSTLSLVLLGKRPLPFRDTPRVLSILALSPKERTLFVESLGKRHLSIDQIKISQGEERAFLDEETYYRVIAEWEHYAVFTLFDCEEFCPTAEDISEKLGITPVRAQVVLDNLISYGLLKQTEDGFLSKSFPKIRTTEDVASEALKASHLDTLTLAQRKLQEVPLEMRDFSSLTVAVDVEKLSEAKTIIREFRQKMDELLKTGRKRHVYQLAIQFFPLTEVELETKNRSPNPKARGV
jgi:uncharacterized protein (TIGR02147 family)